MKETTIFIVVVVLCLSIAWTSGFYGGRGYELEKTDAYFNAAADAVADAQRACETAL